MNCVRLRSFTLGCVCSRRASESYVHGPEEYPETARPDNIEPLYYSFHFIMTLGAIFILLMAYAMFQNRRVRLESSTWLLWILLPALPFAYIANTLGWVTAELGRQPWLVYGLFHKRDGYSKVVSSGDTLFPLIGFVGLYFVWGLRRANGKPSRLSSKMREHIGR